MSVADKLQIIAENEQRVYEAGKQAEYDAFWDTYQQNGNRTDYAYGFAGVGWNEQTIKPKYKCVPVVANNMFNKVGYVDFRKIADKFDFSQITNATGMFISSNMDFITADFSSATSLNTAFRYSYATTITLKVAPVVTNAVNMFDGASNLKNLTFTDDSEIAWDDLNLRSCTGLTKESITSVINALSPNTSGLTVKFSKTAKESAFTTDEWNALIATKQNWTINAV